MSAKDRTAWFWSDWRADEEVRRLTPAERGMWIDLLSFAAVGTPKGYVTDKKGRPLPLEEIARFANCASPNEAAELIDGVLKKGAASRDRAGRLFNRRMVRDEEVSAQKRTAGKKGAESTRLKWLGFQAEPLPLPGHVPRQNGKTIPLSKITSSEYDATRVAVPRVRSPFVEPQQGLAVKRPSDLSKAELEESFARKRSHA